MVDGGTVIYASSHTISIVFGCFYSSGVNDDDDEDGERMRARRFAFDSRREPSARMNAADQCLTTCFPLERRR